MWKTLKSAVGRALYVGLFQWLPTSYAMVQIGQRKGRAFCCRMFMAECGKNVNIERRAILSSKVELGDHSGIGIHASISGKCVIGNDVMMGPHCTVYSRNHRFDDTSRTMRGQGFQEEKPVIIGDDVWIGGHVILLPGVRVGSHSIIGDGAVVTKDVPEWAVVAGNPAVVKKFRGGVIIAAFRRLCDAASARTQYHGEIDSFCARSLLTTSWR